MGTRPETNSGTDPQQMLGRIVAVLAISCLAALFGTVEMSRAAARPTQLLHAPLFLPATQSTATAFRSTIANSAPKTVAQCKKVFKGRSKSKARTACIKRVEREKFGGCEHKFKAGTTGTENFGDQAEISIEVVGYDSNLPQGSTEHLRLKVAVHDPRVTVCPKAELKLWSRPHNEEFGPGVLHTFFVAVPPGGGLSSEAETEVGQYMAFAWAEPLKP